LHNNYTGEYDLEIDGRVYKVKFTWRALSDLKTLYPDKSVQELLQSVDPDILCDMIVCGTAGAVNKDQLLDARNLPLMVAAKVLDTAITAAFLGAEVAEKVAEEAEKTDDKKKTK